MRASVERDDPGFSALNRRIGPESITLDDVVMREVITADEEQGFVKLFARNPEGEPYAIGDVWATEIRRGRVEITLREEG